MDNYEGPPRAALIAALVLAVGAIGVVLAVAATRHPPRQPVVVAAVPAPHTDNAACRALFDALPQRLGDYQRAPIAQPTPPGAAAWRAGGDGEPVVLRCGLDRPADFVVGAPIQVVDGVQWFALRQDDRSTWYTVDRPVYVALTLPPGSGPTPIQQLSDLIDQVMPAVPINPGRGT
ncbi:DUF3515 domain-containing protein [Mycobacterium shimoidei]|uniref:DUF3515 domain-containing protein n=1 Tax=Mycobacterium shimoidei TaxID=29313 RepID=A0A1E3TIR5_MYCSH|nr:DUF3515 domain-containing protein [Mycobacterium shimoidei]MCV7257347.1 DUF3515 domain-containing protein [Mycobacterium shimoidei]ODR14325.1 hypothetical protein BHQ16_05240 [Mycobacterium shimoidei]ORW80402.1 hypothetical protein AWC26_10915 [Mycobacterium shimoidei]SRX95961.1 hypothetical protein MSP7336_04234 [Mycobacterium shimoidei]